jgi:hypothetical protein
LKNQKKGRIQRVSATAPTALPQGHRPSAAPSGIGAPEKPESSALEEAEKRTPDSTRMLNASGPKVEVLLLQARDLTRKEADRCVLALRDWVDEKN